MKSLLIICFLFAITIKLSFSQTWVHACYTFKFKSLVKWDFWYLDKHNQAKNDFKDCSFVPLEKGFDVLCIDGAYFDYVWDKSLYYNKIDEHLNGFFNDINVTFELFNTSKIINLYWQNYCSECCNPQYLNFVAQKDDYSYLDINNFPSNSTFNWLYRINNGSWIQGFPNQSSLQLPVASNPAIQNALNSTVGPNSVEIKVRVEVKDANGHTWSSSDQTINLLKSAPSIQSVTSQKTCSTDTTALVKFNNNGYTPFYLYYRKNDNTQDDFIKLSGFSDAIVSNLTPGTYNFHTSNESQKCNTSQVTVTVTQYPSTFGTTLSYDNNICPGTMIAPVANFNNQGKGSYKIKVLRNQTTLKTYTLPVSTTSQTLITLPKGNYTFTITDGCNHTESKPITITEINPALSLQLTGPYCDMPYKAALIDTVDIDQIYTMDYLKITEMNTNTIVYNKSFDWNYPAVTIWIPKYNGSIKFNVAAKSTYTFQSTYKIKGNSRICVTNLFVPVTANTPHPFIESTLQTKDPDCYNYQDGFISLRVNSSDFNMFYSPGKFITSSTNVFKKDLLPAGTYQTYFLRKDLACKDSFFYGNIVLKNPEEVPINYTKSDDCFDDGSGKINLTSVLNKSYTFTLNHSDFSGPRTQTAALGSYSFSGLGTGSYSIQSKENYGNNCISELKSLSLYQNANIKADLIDSIQCFGELAQVLLRPADPAKGSGSYSLSLNSDANITTLIDTGLQSLIKGNYVLTYSDNNSTCLPQQKQISIKGPTSLLTFNAVSPTNTWGYQINCFDQLQGKITATANGGGTNYQFHLYPDQGNKATSQTGIFEQLTAGNYRLEVLDNFACKKDTILTLNQPTEIQASLISATQAACSGDTSAQMVIGAEGGIEPYFYSKNPLSNFSSSDTIKNLAVGEHNVFVKDAAGCIQSIMAEILSLSPPIEVDNKIKNATCFDKTDGSIVIHPVHDTAVYQYKWLEFPGKLSPLLNNVKQGNYHVSIKDIFGCEKVLPFLIESPSKLMISTKTDPICWGETFGAATVQVSGGVTPYKYILDNATNYNTAEIHSIGPGNHTIKVLDKNACEIKKDIFIEAKTVPVISDFLVASNIKIEETAVIVDVSLPKPDSVIWHFDPEIELTNQSMAAPEVIFPHYGNFNVRMDCYYDGCMYTVSKEITVDYKEGEIQKSAQLSGFKTIQVSPNPNDGNFDLEIELWEENEFTVFIRDISGNEFYRNMIPLTNYLQSFINMSGLLPGTYIICAVMKGDIIEKKVIIH